MKSCQNTIIGHDFPLFFPLFAYFMLQKEKRPGRGRKEGVLLTELDFGWNLQRFGLLQHFLVEKKNKKNGELRRHDRPSLHLPSVIKGRTDLETAWTILDQAKPSKSAWFGSIKAGLGPVRIGCCLSFDPRRFRMGRQSLSLTIRVACKAAYTHTKYGFGRTENLLANLDTWLWIAYR